METESSHISQVLISEENISKIEVLQRKCVRIMGVAAFDSHSNELFIDLGLVKVRDLISMNQLKLVYFSMVTLFVSRVLGLPGIKGGTLCPPSVNSSKIEIMIFLSYKC